MNFISETSSFILRGICILLGLLIAIFGFKQSLKRKSPWWGINKVMTFLGLIIVGVTIVLFFIDKGLLEKSIAEKSVNQTEIINIRQEITNVKKMQAPRKLERSKFWSLLEDNGFKNDPSAYKIYPDGEDKITIRWFDQGKPLKVNFSVNSGDYEAKDLANDIKYALLGYMPTDLKLVEYASCNLKGIHIFYDDEIGITHDIENIANVFSGLDIIVTMTPRSIIYTPEFDKYRFWIHVGRKVEPEIDR